MNRPARKRSSHRRARRHREERPTHHERERTTRSSFAGCTTRRRRRPNHRHADLSEVGEAMTTRLRMTGIRKSYGPTAALRGVDLESARARFTPRRRERGRQVHADEGAQRRGAARRRHARARRPAVPPARAAEARRRGVAMVYQELAVCPDLSVEANVLLGRSAANCGFLDGRPTGSMRAGALRELGHPEIDPHAPVSALSPAARQVVEIARALLGREGARPRRADECLATRGRAPAVRPREAAEGARRHGRLHQPLPRRDRGGRGPVHGAARRRGGGTGKVGEVPREKIIEMMVGRAVEEQYPRIPHAIGEPVLELAELCGDPFRPA